MRLHLEALAEPDDNALFALIPNGTAFNIKPKTLNTYLTVNGGNDNSLGGVSGKDGGPTGYTDTKGIIGIYPSLDGNSNFYLENAAIHSPVITNNHDGTFTITAEAGATIYYEPPLLCRLLTPVQRQSLYLRQKVWLLSRLWHT